MATGAWGLAAGCLSPSPRLRGCHRMKEKGELTVLPRLCPRQGESQAQLPAATSAPRTRPVCRGPCARPPALAQRLGPQLTVQCLLAAPVVPGHQLHGQVRLDAGQHRPGRLPVDAQGAEVVEPAALVVIGSHVQEGVAVAGDRNLQEAKVGLCGRAQSTRAQGSKGAPRATLAQPRLTTPCARSPVGGLTRSGGCWGH